jgi:two-component system response regulator RegX3
VGERILVVEDELPIAEAVGYALRDAGYEVDIVGDGDGGLAAARERPFDLMVLDLMLPGLGGLDVCRAVRAESDLPIVMLTARDAEVDRVLGLEIGADDYVTKPFSSRELIARVRAVLRRGGEPDELITNTVEAGPVRMDVERHTVSVDGHQVNMPLKEFDLLELLLRNAGRVLTRGQLIDRVWGSDYVGDTKTSTSSGCARRSNPIRAIRSTSSPSADSATSSRSEPSSALAGACAHPVGRTG